MLNHLARILRLRGSLFNRSLFGIGISWNVFLLIVEGCINVILGHQSMLKCYPCLSVDSETTSSVISKCWDISQPWMDSKDPLSDSVRRSDQLLQETIGADQWNQRIPTRSNSLDRRMSPKVNRGPKTDMSGRQGRQLSIVIAGFWNFIFGQQQTTRRHWRPII